VFGDFVFDSAALLAGGRDVRSVAVAVAAGVAGFELDGEDLLGERGREGVGVVLFADEQMPEWLGHLSGGRNDRDWVPAAGADPLIERA
jgi:hypothetical protein